MKENLSPSISLQRLPIKVQDFVQKIRPHSYSIVLGGSRTNSSEEESEMMFLKFKVDKDIIHSLKLCLLKTISFRLFSPISNEESEFVLTRT